MSEVSQDGAPRPWLPQHFAASVFHLVAARRLLQVNLACNLRRPGFAEYAERHALKLRSWLEGAPRS